MTAGTVCSRVIATATPGESVRDAATRMQEHEVGTLLVIEPGTERPRGLVTDRDLTVRCVAAGLDPETTPIEQVMSTPVNVVDEDMAVEDALARMSAAGTRRLIVVGRGNRAVGVLSLDDCLGLLCRDAVAINRLIEKQQPRIPATA